MVVISYGSLHTQSVHINFTCVGNRDSLMRATIGWSPLKVLGSFNCSVHGKTDQFWLSLRVTGKCEFMCQLWIVLCLRPPSVGQVLPGFLFH